MVNDNDGNTLAFILGTDFEGLAMQAITYLNVNYNPYNIYFKYRGFDTHNNTTATTTANGTTINGIYQPGYLNIFFVNSAGGASGLAYFGSPVCWMAWETLQDPYYFEYVLCHEIGHCLKLFHTNFLFIPECEHVTRDIDSPDYNADIAGDLVEDTPAVGYLNPAYDANCEYIFNPNYQDCQETPYENITKNFMSSESNNCTHISLGIGAAYAGTSRELTPKLGQRSDYGGRVVSAV